MMINKLKGLVVKVSAWSVEQGEKTRDYLEVVFGTPARVPPGTLLSTGTPGHVSEFLGRRSGPNS